MYLHATELILIIIILTFQIRNYQISKTILKNQKTIMATIEDALAKIDELKDKFDAYKQVVTDEFAALKAQIAAGSAATPEQLDQIIAKAQAAEDDIASAPTAPTEG